MNKDLMWLELAMDGEQLGGDSPASEGTEAATEQPGEGSAEATTPEQTISEYDVDGEKVTVDTIREWKKGNMRQSDYTRKTQEIAALKKEHAEAMEVYEHLKNNPALVQRLLEETPEISDKVGNLKNPELQTLQMEVNTMKINSELEVLKAKDPDFDEMAVLNIAVNENLPIEKAYKMWRAENLDSLIERKLKQQSIEMTEKIKNNNEKTNTLITTKQAKSDLNLSDAEMSMAEKLGMTYAEYAKWK